MSSFNLYNSPEITDKSIIFDNSDGSTKKYAKSISTVNFDGTDRTIEFTFKARETQPGSGRYILNIDDYIKLSAYFNQNTNNYMLDIGGRCFERYSDSTFSIVIQKNTLYTFAITIDSSQAKKLYLNGELIGEYTSYWSSLDSSKTVYVCSDYYTNAEVFAFRVYNKLLTLAEIESNYAKDQERFN